jgi:HPt (histidine-containing phosphotransfer) domain-containing protein
MPGKTPLIYENNKIAVEKSPPSIYHEYLENGQYRRSEIARQQNPSKRRCMGNGKEKKKSAGNILVQIDPDLEELIPGYLENRRRDIQSIEEALKREDFETSQRLGHTMKGSGGGYGFDAISAIGMAIEEASKIRSRDKVRLAVLELTDYLDRVKVVYE